MQYLKDNQYYVDRYDLSTIEECLDWYWKMKKSFDDNRHNKDFEKYSDEDFKKESLKVINYSVNIIAGERYRHKSKTIKEWMAKDRSLQERFDSAVPHSDVLCNKCNSESNVIHKDLFDTEDSHPLVIFMFECTECQKRQAFYDNGALFETKPIPCPTCSAPLTDTVTYVDNIMTTLTSCSHCKYRNEDVYDFKKSREEREAREAKEEQLLSEYRTQFCWDEKTGQQYLSAIQGLTTLAKQFQEEERKSKDPIYQKARALHNLTIHELKESLEKRIAGECYSDLQFGNPEMGKHVIVEFSVYDTKHGRQEYVSKNTLKKVIKEEIKNTTWRLMSDGISYRLGILSGRLKAYEREEDVVKVLYE